MSSKTPSKPKGNTPISLKNTPTVGQGSKKAIAANLNVEVDGSSAPEIAQPYKDDITKALVALSDSVASAQAELGILASRIAPVLVSTASANPEETAKELKREQSQLELEIVEIADRVDDLRITIRDLCYSVAL